VGRHALHQKKSASASTQAVIQSTNRSHVRLSIDDGDVKDGIHTDAVKMFNSLNKPAVYVPGDNEWRRSRSPSPAACNSQAWCWRCRATRALTRPRRKRWASAKTPVSTATAPSRPR
jgi:hypothetical protein